MEKRETKLGQERFGRQFNGAISNVHICRANL